MNRYLQINEVKILIFLICVNFFITNSHTEKEILPSKLQSKKLSNYNPKTYSTLDLKLPLVATDIRETIPEDINYNDINKVLAPEVCDNGINDDGDGFKNNLDTHFFFKEISTLTADYDGDGITDNMDLDKDNDGIPDEDECSGVTYGSELITNGDFENGYAHWTSDFNRGINNRFGTDGGCGDQGWVALSPCASQNGGCGTYYEYNGSTPTGSTLITSNLGTGANVITTSTCNSTSGSCWAQSLPDHTTGSGLSLYVDPNDIVGESYWIQTINIQANTFYEFSAWIMVIEEDPNLVFKINNTNLTNVFNLDRQTGGSDGTDVWQPVLTTWFSGSNSGNVIIELVNVTAGCGGNDIRLDDVSFRKVNNLCDCDGDGIANIYDLDSDNDGISDLDEAGHTAADSNNDGVIDGLNSAFGTNGLFNNIETSSNSGIINYTIKNSENLPDATYDFCETDSDGDGCLDTQEASISDNDNDGVAGSGTPTITTKGLVSNLSYTNPANSNWQNPAVQASVCGENCSNGIDDDGDGLIDCADPDCYLVSNTGGTDTDGDGIDDDCDEDDDNDGILDVVECPATNSGLTGPLTTFTTSITTTDATSSSVSHTLNSITYNGVTYSDFITPDVYTPGYTVVDLNEVNFVQNGVDYVYSLGSNANYNTDIITDAFGNKNLNAHQSLDSEDFSNGDYYILTYNDPIISTSGGFIAVTERLGNNEYYIDALDKFNNVLGSIIINTTDYVDLGVNVYAYGTQNANMALYPIDDLAPIGSEISSLKISFGTSVTATNDGPDGKVFVIGDVSQIVCDYDGDGIPNDKDLDSDNDGCSDALEGSGNIASANVINDRIGGTVNNDGIPALANGGQGLGASQDENTTLGCNEICNDGQDNDGDGFIDCADSDCAPIISNVAVTQPNCSNKTGGQIVITASGNNTLSYSINHSSVYQASNIFSNLSIGQYIIRVRNDAGCVAEYTNNPVVLDMPTCIEICNDGIDNDGDGNIDCEDSDCGSLGTANQINDN